MSPTKPQRGSTLIVALIMLVLLTLIAVSAINSTTSSIQVVGNAQFHEEAGAAAQQTIEQVMSSNFPSNATQVSTPIQGYVNGMLVYTGQVNPPVCTSSMALTNAQIDFNNPASKACTSSDRKSNTGMIGPNGVVATTNSLCFKQSWDIEADVANSGSGASTTVHQGVFVNVESGTPCP